MFKISLQLVRTILELKKKQLQLNAHSEYQLIASKIRHCSWVSLRKIKQSKNWESSQMERETNISSTDFDKKQLVTREND